jgi:lipopolysaccharide transport system permease protein
MSLPAISYEIRPPKRLVGINFPELWRFRELLYIFVWRNIKVRYKQTVLGVAWAVFQPLLTMLIFTLFFGRLAKVPSEGIPYPVFVFTGLLLWTYFSTALANASNSLVESESIIQKVYFPRLLLPLSTAVTPAIDFLFAYLVLLGLTLYYGFTPMLTSVVFFPLLILAAFVSVIGPALFLSALNVKYRDVRYIIPFFIQILLFLTPVIYPVTLVPEQFRWLLFVNPMAGVVSVARSLMLSVPLPEVQFLAISLGAGLLTFVIGLLYFRKTERFFADIL